ncbi:MAG: FAD-binding protein [Spirochaetaceae bacterium]|nr:MAG: FAD-binding protein [Spirochaetaceae bacterium]
MGYKEYELTMPVQAYESEEKLRSLIQRKSKLGSFSYTILKKSLDARRKSRIEWRLRVGVVSPELKGGEEPRPVRLNPERRRRGAPVVVVGTGPAGIFAALYLLRAGYEVTLLERGDSVEGRRAAIQSFESGGAFSSLNNYSFGEGGAGTFSDGKLSSRTKNISAERNFIFDALVEAGAPEEIRYMTHPHVGSDVLFGVTQQLRAMIEAEGGRVLFRRQANDLVIKAGRVTGVKFLGRDGMAGGALDAGRLLFACGHSAHETYRMLLRRGVPFRVKNSAIGFRAEHPQELINEAQWGQAHLPGVKAAEYRLTAQTSSGLGVYSFCMCPGGVVVPAAAYAGTNIVNGMSNYARDGRFANAAVVVGLNLPELLGREVEAAEALDWVTEREHFFYQTAAGYRAPAMPIREFMKPSSAGSAFAGKGMQQGSERSAAEYQSSYPLGLVETDLRESLPAPIIGALQEGLAEFVRKLGGYENGLLLGLESKSSAPIQVERDPAHLTAGYSNLYVAGEGGGWSGGIVSSAADGLRVAQAIVAADG